MTAGETLKCWVPKFPGQRPPFTPGNEMAVKHGAGSPRKVAPIAAELMQELFADETVSYLFGGMSTSSPGSGGSMQPGDRLLGIANELDRRGSAHCPRGQALVRFHRQSGSPGRGEGLRMTALAPTRGGGTAASTLCSS